MSVREVTTFPAPLIAIFVLKGKIKIIKIKPVFFLEQSFLSVMENLYISQIELHWRFTCLSED